MNKILTVPKEMENNKRVLYTGNHYISLPEICMRDISVKSLNIISLQNKGLIEIAGEESLFAPCFYKDEKRLNIEKVEADFEYYYIPTFKINLSDNILVKVKIYADIKEKGFIYEVESSQEIDIKIFCNIQTLSFLTFNSHQLDFTKKLKIDKWLGNPVIDIYSNNISFSLAFGGEKDFEFNRLEEDIVLCLNRVNKNAFYITINSDGDGASTTLIHLKRKGYSAIYSELKEWLNKKIIKYNKDKKVQEILNKCLFFNYFFAIGKDLHSDTFVALTSRSSRYYVSGAFWERDSFLWSFPAIKLVDHDLYLELIRHMILMHYKNAGDHAHYIDGTVLYPGFELDEAASYFILLKDLKEIDTEILKALKYILRRIEMEYDTGTGLYKTFLLPSDDPSEYPFVTIDNVILWRGFINLKNVYDKLNMTNESEFLSKRIKGLHEGIYKYLVKKVDNREIFVWSADSHGNFRLYNDPPGNLGLLYYYGFIDYKDEIFKNTINYYYSPNYKYYFNEGKYKELACDHHPNTPSGLGLCASIINPLMREKAIKWVKEATMDYGLLCESFDKDTGEAKTGVGFATGCGYLAYALYYALIEED